MKMITLPSREEWLAYRRRGIGGSDVPAILGLVRYSTPLKVWTDKVGLSEPTPDSYTFRRGHHMERLLWRELEAEVSGIEVSAHSNAICVGAEPWMLYSPDGFVAEVGKPGWVALAEAKSFLRGEAETREGVPPRVMAQVQYGMMVTGLNACYCTFDLGHEFRWAKVERDPAWADTNLPTLREFWRRVMEQDAPPPTSEDADTLAAMYPRASEGKTVALDGSFLDLRWELDKIVAQKKELEARENEIKNRVRAAMGDAERAVLVDGSGWSWVGSERPVMVPHESKKSYSRTLRAFGKKE